MPCYEEFRALLLNVWFYFGRVAGRISPDVRHPHFYAFADKKRVFRVPGPQLVPVDVAVYGPERLERFHPVRQPDVADIAGMPYLVYMLKIMEHFRVKVTVRVRHQTDLHPANVENYLVK